MVLLKTSTKNFVVTVQQKKKKDRGTSKRVSHVAIIIRGTICILAPVVVHGF